MTNPTGRNGIKPTNEEMKQRLFRVAELLVNCHPKGKIKRTMRAEFGVGPRTVENYISRVRKEWAEAADLTPEELLAESLAFWRSQIASDKTTQSEKQNARARIERITGMEKQRHEHTHQGEFRVGHIHKLRQDLLNDPDYIEFARSRDSLGHTNAGAIRPASIGGPVGDAVPSGDDRGGDS